MLSFARAVTGAAMASTFALSGCVMGNVGPGPAGSPQSAVEGQWVDSSGVAVSTFSGGGFQTVATDTGNLVSEGSYRYRDGNTIEISMRSLVRQTQLSVNCALVSPTQLNCTNSQGTNFVLTRTS